MSAAKSCKKRFVICKERGDKILRILNEKKGSVDVTEFSSSIKFIMSVIDDILKAKKKERPLVTEERIRKIESLMKEYEDLLVQLANTQRFLRFFTSNRVRKRLDQINTQLHREISQLFLAMQALKRTSTKNSSQKKSDSPQTEKHTQCFKDEEAKHFWEQSFDQALMVEWVDFIRHLQKIIPIDQEADSQLKYILDNSGTSFASMYKFSDFLNGFGPLKLCIEKMQSILNADWFHGFLSSGEAERLLERQPPGTFLIRFSKSKPGSFAIAYVDLNQRNSVTHTLINCVPPSGFKIEESYNRNARGRLFVTLQEVVEFYSYILKTPFRSDLSRQSWFHGDLSSQEAEEILSGEKDGTFVLRFSSHMGFLAVSYVFGKEVKHGLLECLPGGYRFDNQPAIYPSLPEAISNLSDILKYPLTNVTYEVSKKANQSNHRNQPAKNSGSDSASTTGDSNYSSFAHILQRPTQKPVNVASVSLAPSESDGSQYGIMPVKPEQPPPSVQPTIPTVHSSGNADSSPINTFTSSYGAPPSFEEIEEATKKEKENQSAARIMRNSQLPNIPNVNKRLSSSPSSMATSGDLPGLSRTSSESVPENESANANVPSNYGEMPLMDSSSVAAVSPSDTEDYTDLPSTCDLASTGGVLPPPLNAEDYTGLPPPCDLSSNGVLPPPLNAQDYTALPPPCDLSSNVVLPELVNASNSTASSQYGRMPNLASNPSNSSKSPQYGKMPTLSNSTASVPAPNTSNSTASSQYGRMPTPANSTASVPTPNTNNSTASSQYGRMPTPSNSTASVPAPNTSNSTASSQYGRMPTPANSTASAPAPNTFSSPVSSPHGRIPASVPSTSNSASSQYGKMPTPNITDSPSADGTRKGASFYKPLPFKSTSSELAFSTTDKFISMPTSLTNATSSPNTLPITPSVILSTTDSSETEYGTFSALSITAGNYGALPKIPFDSQATNDKKLPKGYAVIPKTKSGE